MTLWTVFEYLYRDASNFKAYGQLVFDGKVSHFDQERIKGKLICKELFIAEQIGVPTLYHELYKWSNGVTRDDHCWHEFSHFCYKNEIDRSSATYYHPNFGEFLETLLNLDYWEEALSPHFCDDGWIKPRMRPPTSSPLVKLL